jgi:hypothetical protein
MSLNLVFENMTIMTIEALLARAEARDDPLGRELAKRLRIELSENRVDYRRAYQDGYDDGHRAGVKAGIEEGASYK